MPNKDEIEAHIAWLEHKDCCNASHSMGVDGLSEKGCNCDQSATLLRALAEDNEDMIKNINLKADFIDATLHQLRTEEERAEAAEARAIAAEEALKLAQERGARAIIAYHTAICCPKGVVPVDDLYDPVMAASISANMDDFLAALAQKEGE